LSEHDRELLEALTRERDELLWINEKQQRLLEKYREETKELKAEISYRLQYYT
jgi:hypothetical protein